MRKPDRRAGRHQDNSGTLADRRLLRLTNRADQREFGKLSNGRVRKDLDAREPFGKGKALGPCELRALLRDAPSSPCTRHGQRRITGHRRTLRSDSARYARALDRAHNLSRLRDEIEIASDRFKGG